MNTPARIVVFGTPSNKGGFDFKLLYGQKLPGQPAKYLDIFERDSMGKGCSEVTQTIEIDGRPFVFIAALQGIKPNDQNTNRGSYIGVAALVEGEVNPEEVVGEICLVAMIMSHLEGLRGEDNAFAPAFSLETYSPPKNITVPDLWLKSELISKQSLRNSSEYEGVLYSHVNRADSLSRAIENGASKLEGLMAEREQEISELQNEIEALRSKVERSTLSERPMRTGTSPVRPQPPAQPFHGLGRRSPIQPIKHRPDVGNGRNSNRPERRRSKRRGKKNLGGNLAYGLAGALLIAIAIFAYRDDFGFWNSVEDAAKPGHEARSVLKLEKPREPEPTIAEQREAAIKKEDT